MTHDINPHTRIESIKAFTPPQSGDRFEHARGIVRLLRPAGGDSWWAVVIETQQRIQVRPTKLQRNHS